jgi:hypothetical protein
MAGTKKLAANAPMARMRAKRMTIMVVMTTTTATFVIK